MENPFHRKYGARSVRGGGRLCAAAAILLVANIAAACGSNGSTSAAGASGTGSKAGIATGRSGTVRVNLRDGNYALLPADPHKIKLALMLSTAAIPFTQAITSGADSVAAKYGISVKTFDANFNSTTQLSQFASILSGKQFNGIIGAPVDGTVMCNAYTRQAAAAHIAVVVVSSPMCGKDLTTPALTNQQEYVAGLLSFIGSSNTITFNEQWFNAAARLLPGPQKAVLLTGPAEIEQTKLFLRSVKQWQPTHPNFHIENVVNTDYTPTGVQSATQTYLQSHRDTTAIMSTYGPDITRPVVQTVKQAGLTSKVKIVDIGGSFYTAGQIKSGTVLMSIPYFPVEEGAYAVQAFVDASQGKAVAGAIDDSIRLGGLGRELIITRKNVDTYKPEFGH
jgi:ribose transport system substrate-binding protein